jgi:hypothetical protein
MPEVGILESLVTPGPGRAFVPTLQAGTFHVQLDRSIPEARDPLVAPALVAGVARVHDRVGPHGALFPVNEPGHKGSLMGDAAGIERMRPVRFSPCGLGRGPGLPLATESTASTAICNDMFLDLPGT